MEDCKSAESPGVSRTDLEQSDESPNTDVKLYQSIVGSLMYLALATRPDISFAVSYLSKFNQQPKEMHLKAAKRVIRYIKGTEHWKMKISPKDGVLNASSDASWCSNIDSKSNAGYVTQIGDNLISWNSSKQKLIALSTMESELMAAHECARELTWLISILEELGESDFVTKPVTIHCDSTATISWVKNGGKHARTKHINRRYHYIRDEAKRRRIQMEYVSTKDQIADIMTKYLTPDMNRKALTQLKFENKRPHSKKNN